MKYFIGFFTLAVMAFAIWACQPEAPETEVTTASTSADYAAYQSWARTVETDTQTVAYLYNRSKSQLQGGKLYYQIEVDTAGADAAAVTFSVKLQGTLFDDPETGEWVDVSGQSVSTTLVGADTTILLNTDVDSFSAVRALYTQEVANLTNGIEVSAKYLKE